MTPRRYKTALYEVDRYFRTAVRLQVGLAVIIFLAGLTVAILAYVLGPEGSDLKLIESLGGLLVSSLSAFPVKELLEVQRKKSSIKSVSSQLDDLIREKEDSVDLASMEKLFNHMLQFMS